MLEESGLQAPGSQAPGQAPSLAGSASESLFRQPAAAVVRKPKLPTPQLPTGRPVRRRDLENDRIYKVHPPLLRTAILALL
jgi:hypothetical protein